MAVKIPSYYAIIPAQVRYDNTLSPNQKLLYGEITALANSTGVCFATNAYFAKLYRTHKKTMSRWLANLVKNGYIQVTMIRDSRKQVVSREIILLPLPAPIHKNVDRGYLQKCGYPTHKNAEDNNTSTNIPPNPQVESVKKSKKQKQPRHKPVNFKYPDNFEKLWATWSSGDKWAAYKAWARVQEHYTQEHLESVLVKEALKSYGRRHTSTVFGGDLDEINTVQQEFEIDWVNVS